MWIRFTGIGMHNLAYLRDIFWVKQLIHGKIALCCVFTACLL